MVFGAGGFVVVRPAVGAPAVGAVTSLGDGEGLGLGDGLGDSDGLGDDRTAFFPVLSGLSGPQPANATTRAAAAMRRRGVMVGSSTR
ncbi:hypothetical protein GCM10010199_24230 [Dactylosporangium roseum]